MLRNTPPLADRPGDGYDVSSMFARFALLLIAAFLLAGCVSTPQGQKFDPWQGALNTDRKIGEWIDKQNQ